MSEAEAVAPPIPCPTCGGPITIPELRGLGQCSACETGHTPPPPSAPPVPADQAAAEGADPNTVTVYALAEAYQLLSSTSADLHLCTGDDFCNAVGKFCDLVLPALEALLLRLTGSTQGPPTALED